MFECSIGGNQYFYSPLFSLILINSDKHVVSPNLFSCDSVLSTLVGVELSADWLSFFMFFWLWEKQLVRGQAGRDQCAQDGRPLLLVLPTRSLPSAWTRHCHFHRTKSVSAKRTYSVFWDSAFSSLVFCSPAAVSMQVTCGSWCRSSL